MSQVRQYMRVAEVVFGANGSGLKVSDLRIQFEVRKTLRRTPNACEVKITNLSQASEKQIRGEYDELLVNVGYQGATRLVLRGNIRQTRAYRAGTDRVLQVIAGDGDRDFRNGTVNFTLAAGTGHEEVVDHVVGKSFTSTKKGHVRTSSKKRIRGRVFSGMARDALDDVAREAEAHWSIQDGVLHIVPVDSTLPNEAIVLSADTGLLEAPEVTDKGIAFKCLLNPELTVNGKVWLDNNGVKERVRKGVEAKQGAVKHKKKQGTRGGARLDPDGIYKLISVTHKGDTRGASWVSECLCVALGKPIPAGKVAA